MQQIMEYVKPELLIVTVVLYFIGNAIKKSEYIMDKYIPILLGVLGIVICSVWVVSTTTADTLQEALMAVFTAFTQGILVAGLSTYINQILKQVKKEE